MTPPRVAFGKFRQIKKRQQRIRMVGKDFWVSLMKGLL
jgi:hypothetical protein